MHKRKNIFEDDSDYDVEMELEHQEPSTIPNKEELKSRDSSTDFRSNKIKLNFGVHIDKKDDSSKSGSLESEHVV
jgi:hypothetical protein